MVTVSTRGDGKKGRPLNRPWKKLITVGRAYELLRTDLRKHLDKAQREIGWEYCRFHALFHDDMAVVKKVKDDIRFQWRTIGEIYDTLLDVGLRPFAELNPMPNALASGERTIFWYKMNVTPPKDFAEWENLIEEYARFCIRRYGRAEVRKWYFELWNEPNMPGFWTGGFDGYVKLYEHTVAALHRVDRNLRVGGPATAGADWIPEFAGLCAKRGLPVDFFSTHRYPQDAFTPIGGERPAGFDIEKDFDDSFRRVRDDVKSSAYPDAEIHWTEWNCQAATGPDEVSWGFNRYVESSYAGSFIARHCTELDNACDSMGWWALSDIFEEPGPQLHPFNCGYGLISVDGLAKASYNAFSFLNQMDGDLLEVDLGEDAPEGCGGIACESQGVTRLLLWNHPALSNPNAPVWKSRVASPDAEALSTIRVIERGKGSVVEVWEQIGCPANLNKQTHALLEAASQPGCRLLPQENSEHPFALAPYSVALCEWTAKEPMAIGKGMQAYGKSAKKQDEDILETLLSGKDA